MRQGEEPRRKSPPPREVGPREEAPEGDQQQTQPEISQEESQGGEPVDAPLGSIFKPHWGEWYALCQNFQETWDITQNYTVNHIWPAGIQTVEGQIFSWNKLCVPSSLQKQWVREFMQCRVM